jgi:hypothetical protein
VAYFKELSRGTILKHGATQAPTHTNLLSAMKNTLTKISYVQTSVDPFVQLVVNGGAGALTNIRRNTHARGGEQTVHLLLMTRGWERVMSQARKGHRGEEWK